MEATEFKATGLEDPKIYLFQNARTVVSFLVLMLAKIDVSAQIIRQEADSLTRG